MIAIAESYRAEDRDEFDYGPTLMLAITAKQLDAVVALLKANALLNAVLQITADELAYLETILAYLLDAYPDLFSFEIINILLLTDSKIQYLQFFADELMATAIDNALIKEHIVDIMRAIDPKALFYALIFMQAQGLGPEFKQTVLTHPHLASLLHVYKLLAQNRRLDEGSLLNRESIMMISTYQHVLDLEQALTDLSHHALSITKDQFDLLINPSAAKIARYFTHISKQQEAVPVHRSPIPPSLLFTEAKQATPPSSVGAASAGRQPAGAVLLEL